MFCLKNNSPTSILCVCLKTNTAISMLKEKQKKLPHNDTVGTISKSNIKIAERGKIDTLQELLNIREHLNSHPVFAGGPCYSSY